MNLFLFFYFLLNFGVFLCAPLCPIEGIRIWKILLPGQLLGELVFGLNGESSPFLKFLNKRIK